MIETKEKFTPNSLRISHEALLKLEVMLDKGLADIEAGRFSSLEEVRARLEEKFYQNLKKIA